MTEFSVSVSKSPQTTLMTIRVVSSSNPLNNETKIFKVIDSAASNVSTFKGVCTVNELLTLPITNSLVNDYRSDTISFPCDPEDYLECEANVLTSVLRLSKELDLYAQGVETSGYIVTAQGWA